MGQLLIGNFNAEKYWNPEDFLLLPAFHDKQADNIVNVMDETQFVFSKKPSDMLITRLAINEYLEEYIKNCGFHFTNYGLIKRNELTDNSFDENIYNLIARSKSLPDIFKKEKFFLNPYAVDPYIIKLNDFFGLKTKLPDLETIRLVNSKAFSFQISKTIQNINDFYVQSVEELEQFGKQILCKNKLLIKEEFGVSGKGTLCLESEKFLNRIIKYINTNPNKKISYILQPLLEKEIDFSCQINVDETKRYSIYGIQKMANNNFSFAGITKADEQLEKIVEKSGYYLKMEKVVNEVINQGYHGHLCIDSMILKNGEVIPLIEINARKSMGFINFCLTQYFNKFEKNCFLNVYSLGFNEKVPFELLFEHLLKQELLFSINKPVGVFPLASNPFDINMYVNPEIKDLLPYKGRFYAMLVYKKNEDKDQLDLKLKQLFSNLNITCFN